MTYDLATEMMQTVPRAATAAILAVALAAPDARADEPSRFRLFPGLDETPPAEALARDIALMSRPLARRTQPPETPAASAAGGAATAATPKRFWLAAGELVLMEVAPWVHNRYIHDEEYAYISWQTVADNLHAGLTLGDDHDKFTTDQLGHPVHGAFYYNAARSNGLSFGESIPFAIVGAYAWQLVFERDAHSFNDFSTTSMNGPTIGEPFHRLALMVRDDRTRGTERILRELAEGSPGGWSLTVALNDSATALSTGLPGLEKTCST